MSRYIALDPRDPDYYDPVDDYDCESFADIIEWVRDHDVLKEKIQAIFLWSQTDEGVYKPRDASLRIMLEWLDDPHNQATVTLANMIGEVQCELYSIFDYHKRELYQRKQEDYL